jgi:hypothetical protein
MLPSTAETLPKISLFSTPERACECLPSALANALAIALAIALLQIR